MASPCFSASRVCSILAGGDGELDYMIPGSDDDLEMGEMDVNESEVVTEFLERGGDSDTDEGGSGSDVAFLDRGGDGDTGGSGMDEGGVGVERVWRKTRRGGAPGSTAVGELPAGTAYPAEREATARGVRGGVEVVKVVAGEPPGRHRMTGSGPVQVPQWTLLHSPKSSIPPSPCTRILLEFFSGYSLQSSLSLWLQRPIASPRTAPWTPQ